MALICIENFEREQEEKLDKYFFDAYMNEKLIRAIYNLFEKQPPMPSFEEFKAPKKDETFTEEEKEKLREKRKQILAKQEVNNETI